MVNVEYADVTKLSKRLQFAYDHVPFLVDTWLHKSVGPALVTAMKARAPVDTGLLRSSIRQIDSPGSVRVGPIGVDYNKYVVEGTKPHTIKAKPGKTLVFQMGGKTIFAKSVKHPGTKPNPYMTVSAKDITKRMLPTLAKLTIDLKKMEDV